MMGRTASPNRFVGHIRRIAGSSRDLVTTPECSFAQMRPKPREAPLIDQISLFTVFSVELRYVLQA
jgi:hypothetical protein